MSRRSMMIEDVKGAVKLAAEIWANGLYLFLFLLLLLAPVFVLWVILSLLVEKV